MPLEFDTNEDNFAKIRVFGVGGAGNNAINRMVESGVKGVDFIAVNTDKQTLLRCKAEKKIQIGEKLTSGLGAGGIPEVGRKSAEESIDELKDAVDGANLIFISCGLGGGTGTGAAPVIGSIAQEYKKKADCLIVGVVTLPFEFEGKPRAKAAEIGYAELSKVVDTIITIPNNRLLSAVGKGTSILDAFKVADDVLRQSVQGIVDLIVKPALIKLDFADVRTVMSQKGVAHIGFGTSKGENKTVEAAKMAVSSPLLETNIQGAKAILLNFTGDEKLGLDEINEAARMIQAAADPDVNLLFGHCIDPDFDDEVCITVIATGFNSSMDLNTEQNDNFAGSYNQEKPAAHFFERASERESVKESADTITYDAPVKKEVTLSGSSYDQGDVTKSDLKYNTRFDSDDTLDIPAFIKRKPLRR